MLALHFTTKHELISVHVVSLSCLDATIVHPREVLQGVLLSNAAAFFVIDKHPSGDPTPSPDDRTIVHRLKAAADVMGVDLLDALIVTDTERYFSFKEQGCCDAGRHLRPRGAKDRRPALDALIGAPDVGGSTSLLAPRSTRAQPSPSREPPR